MCDTGRRIPGTVAQNILTPESNVQFGEGGAGLFSDGKLYSQIKDPKFLGRKVMREFVSCRRARRNTVCQQTPHRHLPPYRRGGGNARRNHQPGWRGAFRKQNDRSADRERQPRGGVSPAMRPFRSRHVVLAPGHSSRIPSACCSVAVYSSSPSRSLLVSRIEHPQSLIDRARLGKYAGHPELGAADYKLVHHAKNGRAVYSFCMCLEAPSWPRRLNRNAS